jgi:hypothetical protein
MPTQTQRCGGDKLLPIFDPVIEGSDRSEGHPDRLNEAKLCFFSIQINVRSVHDRTNKKKGRTEIREIFLYYKWLL